MIVRDVFRPAPIRGATARLGRAASGWPRGPAPAVHDVPIRVEECTMIRSFRWPLLTGALAAAVAAGRYSGLPTAQGQPASGATAIPKELTSYRDVVKQVLPAVVTIESKAKAKKGEATTRR